MIDYNVPGGKMVRAFSVVDSCQLMKGEKMTEDEVFLACALGWCTEWVSKDVLIEMGIYYQVQNDYLDTYGDPNVFGKTGTDIEECKCSWLIVKALELANDEQKKILSENYGSTDPEKVAKVKELYQTLKLKGVYEEYESNIYADLIKSIEAHPSKAVQGVLKSCLGKIYKGHN
nr:chrysanthemyl diphosphate synthase [Tanacetum cinerariifolium]